MYEGHTEVQPATQAETPAAAPLVVPTVAAAPGPAVPAPAPPATDPVPPAPAPVQSADPSPSSKTVTCKTGSWTPWYTLLLTWLLVLMGVVAWVIPHRSQPPDAQCWAWIVVLLLFGFWTAVAGQGITGLWRGLFIDERNKISLSRLQMAAWTIILLSAFLAAVVSNVARGEADPMQVSIPQELWLAMGISVTSLIGSPLILGTKKNKDPDPGQAARTLSLLEAQQPTTVPDNAGLVVVNRCPEDSNWANLFQGEETGNGAHLDLAKVQMFYFTVVLVGAYAFSLGALFHGTTAIHQFPALTESMVALLALSHAGYLTSKAVPHSQTATSAGGS